jgi:hypothetical protein
MQAESWIHARLTNWGHWARTRTHYGHCYSIEHQYRSPQHWNPPEPRIVVDVPEAMEVERVMRHIPRRHSVALACHFVWRLPQKACCQRVMLRFDLWDEFLGDAMHMVQNRLTFAGKGETMRSNSRKTLHFEMIGATRR